MKTEEEHENYGQDSRYIVRVGTDYGQNTPAHSAQQHKLTHGTQQNHIIFCERF
jgi:uncharacterized protein YheU (UPF0270 family)